MPASASEEPSQGPPGTRSARNILEVMQVMLIVEIAPHTQFAVQQPGSVMAIPIAMPV